MATRKKLPTTPPAPTPALRFEATLGRTTRARALGAAAALDLDRLPDPTGKVRLLLSADDARRLLEQGYEVHLTAALPVAPLDKALVMSDSQATDWLEQQVKGIARKGGR